jgi:hypothetical protein
MMEIAITDKMRNKAHKKSQAMGSLRRSITRGQGNVIGFLGEEIARKVLGGEEHNTHNYDLIVSNKRIEVKTKKTSVTPKENYECSVADLTRKQECDYFAFVRVLNDQSKGWFLGLKDRDEYYKEAVYLTKGQYDPSNNFVVKANCYNLPISSLSFDVEGIISDGSKI